MTKEELEIENKLLKKAIKGYRKVLYDKGDKFNYDTIEIKKIANNNGLSLNDVLCGDRESHIVAVKRKIALFFRAKNYTYERIAIMLNYTNHASVLYLCKGKN